MTSTVNNQVVVSHAPCTQVVIMLVMSSGKHNVTVLHLSVCPSAYSP